MKVPADMVLTLILPFRPASKASTYIDRFINVKKNMNPWEWENEEFKYRIMQDHTRVSLSRAALAELMPPPYLSENKINIIVTKWNKNYLHNKNLNRIFTQELPFQMQCMLERC